MELDPKIIEGKTYLDCFDTEVAKEFISKECYLSDSVASFANVDNLNKATLREVNDGDKYPYKLENIRWHYWSLFILPCEWVEKNKEPEKKWRPYTGIEFAEKFDLKLGGIIRLKNTITQYKYKTIFTGYRWHNEDFDVFLNGGWMNMNTLLNTYEYEEDGEWKPFGVEE